jgi:hypothetical protein
MAVTGQSKDQQKLNRTRRLSAALRDNLRRRKAQAKERKASSDPRSPSAGPHDSAGITEKKSSG